MALAADKSSWRRGEPQCHLSSVHPSHQCGCESHIHFIDSVTLGNLIAEGDAVTLGMERDCID